MLTKIIIKRERLNSFVLLLVTRQRFPLFPLLLNIVLASLTSAERQAKEINDIHFRKEVKLPLFRDNMIMYVENSMNHQKAIRISEFSKVSE